MILIKVCFATFFNKRTSVYFKKAVLLFILLSANLKIVADFIKELGEKIK